MGACVLVRPDSVEETLENTYKAWQSDGSTIDYFIQLATNGVDYLSLGTGTDRLIGYQKYI
jgi:hypothetical protein